MTPLTTREKISSHDARVRCRRTREGRVGMTPLSTREKISSHDAHVRCRRTCEQRVGKFPLTTRMYDAVVLVSNA
jgi:hypothetical protein